MATMAVDGAGNLYVPDFFNSRVLRYDDPFGTDALADAVWGQADFQGITCNRGWGFGRARPDGLCLASIPGFGNIKAGVAVDAAGNLWVADNMNNRVVRFPVDPGSGSPAPTADLVLGQADFVGAGEGGGLAQMRHPASVRVDAAARVWVADTDNNRVLRFDPPVRNGMPASQVFGDLRGPVGLEAGPDGAVWVNEDGGRVRPLDRPGGPVVDPDENRGWGGFGLDADSTVLFAGWDLQLVERIKAPDYREKLRLLVGDGDGIYNRTGPRGLAGGKGLEITPGQLIHGDGGRILFWNDPATLQNHKPADGVVGAPDFGSRERWGRAFERMRADGRGRLWVFWGNDWGTTSILAYALPLTSGAQPVQRLDSPVPVLGGGSLDWSGRLLLGGIDFDSHCDCLWLSDADNHRVFRLRDVRGSPVVDIVLGQRDLAGRQCNHGRDRESPTADSLCKPGGLALDHQGNLWVADHNLEAEGNYRLLVYDAATLPEQPPRPVFAVPARHVLGRGGSFTEGRCRPFDADPLCGPFEPAFDRAGQMLLGFNAYLGPRFPMLYRDPLRNPVPQRALGDFHSMPTTYRFDAAGDLYVVDHNRARILIYRDPAGERAPTATPTRVGPTATATAVGSSATPTRAVSTITATATPVVEPSDSPATMVPTPTATGGRVFLPIAIRVHEARPAGVIQSGSAHLLRDAPSRGRGRPARRCIGRAGRGCRAAGRGVPLKLPHLVGGTS